MEWVIIGFAGFLGGMLNAVAGGGSFITLPALLFVGVPPVSANATGTAALLPGYIASAWRFRKNIDFPANFSIYRILLVSFSGGLIGAIALMVTSDRLFSKLVPWLILFATFAFILGPYLTRPPKTKHGEANREQRPSNKMYRVQTVILASVCIYGGYFNGGLGIILLAAFSLMGQSNFQSMNGLKNLISAALTSTAVFLYILGGSVSLTYLAVLGGMAVVGGYTGAAISYRLSHSFLRCLVIVVGCLMTSVFFNQYY